ncbi:MAG: hypothetical protein K2N85_16745 [Lachnospiraceae bacterium]|nr:hypothetical protein [Lachnospiraceae bacterium]
MVSKKVLKNIGVFAMSAMLVAAPALAASANPGDLVARVAVHDVTVHDVHGSETPAPSTPNESTESTAPSGSGGSAESAASSSSGAASAGVSLASKAVVTASGVKLVSTVNGVYHAKSVDGVAVITPAADVLAAFGAANIGSVKMNVVDSVHGPAATASINYGLAVLAADNVAAVKGPELDLNAFLNGKKVVDINQPISIAIGIPASFRQADCDYAVMLIQEGGRVSILPNLSADPNVIAVNTNGFGVYVLIKAPAGSFDKYR